MDKLADNKMINKIQKLLQEARTYVVVEVNNTLLRTYMEIGKLLVEDINLHENEENYQNKTISMLSNLPPVCQRDSQVQILIWGASTGNCQVSWII